jgi:hypothetical protein
VTGLEISLTPGGEEIASIVLDATGDRSSGRASAPRRWCRLPT